MHALENTSSADHVSHIFEFCDLKNKGTFELFFIKGSLTLTCGHQPFSTINIANTKSLCLDGIDSAPPVGKKTENFDY
jgi:hypothetical protein